MRRAQSCWIDVDAQNPRAAVAKVIHMPGGSLEKDAFSAAWIEHSILSASYRPLDQKSSDWIGSVEGAEHLLLGSRSHKGHIRVNQHDHITLPFAKGAQGESFPGGGKDSHPEDAELRFGDGGVDCGGKS